MRIGLTGGIASGKSTVTAILRESGVGVVDADEISRSLTAQGGRALSAIKKEFGLSYFDDQDRLDRRALGELIFSDEQARGKLNGIIHPMVQEEMLLQAESLESSGHNLVVLDIPLLFESGMEALCEQVWLVAASEKTQIQRLMQRDGMTDAQAKARIDSQMPLAQKVKRSDVVIENEGSLQALRAQIDDLLAKYT